MKTRIKAAAILLAAVALLVLWATLKPLVAFLLAIPVWMVSGYLAGRLLRGRGYGVVGDVLLGSAGGVLGNFVLSLAGYGAIKQAWLLGDIIVGVIGAIMVVFLVRLVANNDFGT